MKISIVIPVYNEARHLSACLEAISSQIRPAHEVIVIDNNSSDESAEIAKSFDFVTLIKEAKQGVAHARNSGFDAATGTIVGRIDADTILPADWTTQVAKIFKDTSIAAVSGAPHYYDFALSSVADFADLRIRGHLSRVLGDQNFLWGANMAIRRSAWQKVRSEMCTQAEIHEDFDLGIHLQEHGLKVAYDETLMSGVSARRIDMSFWDFVKYTLASPKTYAHHGLTSRWHMYPVLALCWLAWLPGRAIYRGWDPKTGEFSLLNLVLPDSSRVDPTTNVV